MTPELFLSCGGELRDIEEELSEYVRYCYGHLSKFSFFSLRVPYWLLFNVCPAIYAFPHFESRTPNVSVFYITEWSFWCSNEFNGGQCEMKLRRLQQASFLPCTVENDKRQLQAQSQSRSTSKSGISSGSFLVVLQLTMDIMLSPLEIHLCDCIEREHAEN